MKSGYLQLNSRYQIAEEYADAALPRDCFQPESYSQSYSIYVNQKSIDLAKFFSPISPIHHARGVLRSHSRNIAPM